MLKIAICDDNKFICAEIENIILEYEKICPVQFTIDVFYSGENLLKFIKSEHSFDLIFLDIELGTTTGVTVGKTIRNEFDDYISKIVFISGADGYEMELFQVQPLIFSRKPIDSENIINCVGLAIKLLVKANGFTELNQVEMENVDGGNKYTVASIVLGVVAVAAVGAAIVATGGVATAVVPGLIAYTGISSTVGCAGMAVVAGVEG